MAKQTKKEDKVVKRKSSETKRKVISGEVTSSGFWGLSLKPHTLPPVTIWGDPPKKKAAPKKAKAKSRARRSKK